MILDHFLISSRENNIIKLRDYFNLPESKKKFLNGLENEIQNILEYVEEGERTWNRALLEITKENPDYEFLTTVIHGHLWVNMIGNNGKYEDLSIKSSKHWYEIKNFNNLQPRTEYLLNIMMM